MRFGVIGVGNLGSVLVQKLRERDVEVLEVRKGEIGERECDVYIIALKPDVFRSNMEKIGRFAKSNPVISFAAGVRLEEMRKYIRNPFRAMTNIALNLMVCYPDCSDYLSFFGTEIIVCDGEDEIDSLTSYLASSPALIAYLIHAFVVAALRDGIKYDVAVKVAVSVFRDSAELYRRHGLEEMVKKIATPSGTTVEGINSLMQSNALSNFMEALSATSKKAREL